MEIPPGFLKSLDFHPKHLCNLPDVWFEKVIHNMELCPNHHCIFHKFNTF